jgi:hypothetical protein
VYAETYESSYAEGFRRNCEGMLDDVDVRFVFRRVFTDAAES